MGLILTALGIVRSAIWRILSRLSLWQAVSLALSCLSLFLYVHGNREAARADKAETQVASLQRSIKRANDEAARRTKAAEQITDQLRRQRDEDDKRIAADARALSLRGPGAAACVRPVSQGSGGSHQAIGKPDAAGPALPPSDLAGVPWQWLVTRAQEHDALRGEVLSWREWYRQQEANSAVPH